MKLHQLALAVAIATLPTTSVFAAALDRSGQPMNAFFQDGNYFEAGLSVLDPTVSGKEVNKSGTNRDISDMGESYMFPTAAIKLQPHEKVSVALLYDQPFGANAQYSGANKFVANDVETRDANLAQAQELIADNVQKLAPSAITNAITNAQAQAAAAGTTLSATQIQAIQKQVTDAVTANVTQQVRTELGRLATQTAKDINENINGTTVEVHTQSLSLVTGFQPTKNWNIYAGPVYQTVKANVHLRGTAYSVFNGYDAYVPETGGLGWLAGVAYSKPEIALRAAVTYRSEIDHEMTAKENFNLVPTTGKTKVTTPQSVNLDLQSGIAPDTLAFVNLRWVDWSRFKIQPNEFAQVSKVVGPRVGKPDGFNLVEYSKDQISATAGVGRKFNDQWTGSVAVGWDSGAGNPVSTLGPTKGYWNLGLGVQYSPQKNYFIAGGVKHFWLGDVKAQSGAQAGTSDYLAEFKDNKAWAYGLKIGYKF